MEVVSNNLYSPRDDAARKIFQAPRMATWVTRLNTAWKESGWSAVQLSRRSGVNKDTVYKYLRGNIKTPTHEVIDQLAKAMKVSRAWIMEGVRPEEERQLKLFMAGELQTVRAAGLVIPANVVMRPVIGAVEAGVLQEVFEWPEDRRYLEPYKEISTLPTQKVFGLEVRGESMNVKLSPGTIVFCIKFSDMMGRMPRSGDYVVAKIARHGATEATIKRLIIRDGVRMLYPESTDPAFQAPIAVDDLDQDGEKPPIWALCLRFSGSLLI